MTDLDARRVVELFNGLRARGIDTWDPPPDIAGGDRESVVLALRALTIQADARLASETLVMPAVTSPRTNVGTRRIRSVLDEVVGQARREIVVLGYELSDREVLRLLAERASMGVRVELLLDATQTPVDMLRALWPTGAGPAHLWVTGVNRRGRPIRLHAKAVIADSRRAVIGSANFTRSGLRSNLELAVVLDGPAVARIRAYAAELIARHVVFDAGEIGGVPIGQG